MRLIDDGRRLRGLMNKQVLVNDLIIGSTGKTPRQTLNEAIDLVRKNRKAGVSIIDGIKIIEGTLEERIRRQCPGEPKEILLKAFLNQVREGNMEIHEFGDVMFCSLTKKGAIFKCLFEGKFKEKFEGKRVIIVGNKKR